MKSLGFDHFRRSEYSQASPSRTHARHFGSSSEHFTFLPGGAQLVSIRHYHSAGDMLQQ